MTAFKNALNAPASRYLTPFVVFMLLTELQRFAGPQSIFYIYALKTFLTGGLLFYFFKNRREELPGQLVDWRAAALGCVVLAIWLIPSFFRDFSESSTAFNPGAFESTAAQTAAILVRVSGAVLVVPVMEELLWRSFLMRYLINPDFLKIPIGTWHAFSFAVTVGAFTLVHRPWEWPAAIITGILYGGYLVKTRNLRGCILAHAVTNLGLAVYVILTGQWFFW